MCGRGLGRIPMVSLSIHTPLSLEGEGWGEGEKDGV